MLAKYPHFPTTYLPSTRWKGHSHSHSHSLSSCIVVSVRATRSPIDVDHQQQQPSLSDTDSSTASTRFAAGLGRLKAQRVKALVKRTTLLKQQKITKHDHQPLSQHQCNESSDNCALAQDMDNSDTHSLIIPCNLNVSDNNKTAGRTEPGVSVPTTSAVQSRGWGNRGSIHDLKESRNPLKRRHSTVADGKFFSRKSFKDLGCSDNMIECLKQQLFLRPSHIQAMAFPPVIEGKSCIIADQSGSGKTLAYLIPVIQRLRQEELRGLSKSPSQSPQVIIVVPTAELALQVLSNCRSVSKSGVPFRSMVVTGGFRQRTQLENLQEGVDILIATPGRLMFLIKEGFLLLTNLRCVVLDEVDILFNDEDFEAALQSVINSSLVATQYLFVTATLPVQIYNKLVEVFPDCEVVMGPGMHRVSPGLEEVLVDCSGEDGTEKTPETAFANKKSALLQLVEKGPVPRTIVFCNKIETCRRVENVLKRFDRKGTSLRVLPFHNALVQEKRLENMKEFTNSGCDESRVLICTDRASRGIDFTGVDHVVLFDFPRDPSEYVRRVGRTARGAKGKGRAFIFVVGKQVSLARRIMERNRRGHPLHDVPSAYELMS